MASAIHVAGPCAISTNASGTLTALGYSINGVDIAVQEFMEPVPGDEYGGDAGPPIDVLKHGDIHIITMDLTKWDDTVIGYLDTKVLSGTAGSASAGVLYRADSKFVRLLLVATNFTRNYPLCIPKGDLQLGRVGSRYSIKRLVFEAHMGASGLLWDTTTS